MLGLGSALGLKRRSPKGYVSFREGEIGGRSGVGDDEDGPLTGGWG